MIAIDGPAGSGKGTVAQGAAQALGFHYLDSGAIYRTLGLAALRSGTNPDSASDVSRLLLGIMIEFVSDQVWLDGMDVTQAIREEPVSESASRVSAHAQVRAGLLARQRAFRQMPGLVADGRDMGSVVFPDARLKIFLTASPEARAQRRHKQLIDKGFSANIGALLQDILLRDQRDSARAAGPLRKLVDAIEIDTTNLTASEAVSQVLARYRAIPDGN